MKIYFKRRLFYETELSRVGIFEVSFRESVEMEYLAGLNFVMSQKLIDSSVTLPKLPYICLLVK